LDFVVVRRITEARDLAAGDPHGRGRRKTT
jgi:hypothetical protein